MGCVMAQAHLQMCWQGSTLLPDNDQKVGGEEACERQEHPEGH